MYHEAVEIRGAADPWAPLRGSRAARASVGTMVTLALALLAGSLAWAHARDYQQRLGSLQNNLEVMCTHATGDDEVGQEHFGKGCAQLGEEIRYLRDMRYLYLALGPSVMRASRDATGAATEALTSPAAAVSLCSLLGLACLVGSFLQGLARRTISSAAEEARRAGPPAWAQATRLEAAVAKALSLGERTLPVPKAKQM